ncbi:YggT family protein [Tepidiforma flava]|uniref:YggT family protein n=1 Tax=Tepidiforma flava TaxID=3004094 RepID=A0ABY7M795_9CHLR|nr:YggT family protein [Tepidiforma flava]WBL36410.1 YggT family protein [Tepidiforma flava]
MAEHPDLGDHRAGAAELAPGGPGSPLYQLLFRVTEPIIDPFRRVMPRAGMIDLSPMMAIPALLVMQQLVAMLVVPA